MTFYSIPKARKVQRSNVLVFVDSDSEFSEYRDHTGKRVYLAHGSRKRLYAWEDIDLEHEWRTRYPSGWVRWQPAFLSWLRSHTTEPDLVEYVYFCSDCSIPGDEDDACSVDQSGRQVCQSCLDNHYSMCGDCDTYVREGTFIGDDWYVCQTCLDNRWSWCESCDEYYRSNEGCYGDHDEIDDGGCCSSPEQVFKMRDTDTGLPNDTRRALSLPKGAITEEGLLLMANVLREIRHDLYRKVSEGTGFPNPMTREEALKLQREGDRYWCLAWDIQNGELGNDWQTKEGNFTKRLTKRAYKNFEGLKLPSDVVAKIGNIARENSDGTGVEIEITRDLNMGPEEFYHEDSCWWQSYSSSRCALKTNGGIGLRSFDYTESPDGTVTYKSVTGRAWILPMRYTDQRTLVPTFDAEHADAFIVFNGYGALSGYTPARLIAQMTGWTYRKIELGMEPMYVNNGNGYLVASEEICEPYTDGSFRMGLSEHSDLHAREQQKELAHV